MTFEDLNLHPTLLKAVQEQGYTVPTPIQAQAIPIVMTGRDLLGCAQTGTGKTAAFALPILQYLAQNRLPLSTRQSAHRPIRTLVLAPTRELALQINESFNDYGRYTGLKTTYIFGGVPQNPQVKALDQGIDILVATPGRLLDLMAQRHVDLGTIEVFVLDEADRMLDMGFINDIRKVIAALPRKRQTLLFSATLQPGIRDLAKGLLNDPETVTVAPPASTVDMIDQSLYFVDKTEKIGMLIHLLEKEDVERALVFTRTKHGADKVVRKLIQEGVGAAAIHGNKSQNNRQNALEGFKTGRTRVLVATDIAARGLDIDEVSHVFNLDLPMEPECYVHRIGRTARAGHDGIAVSFCSADERNLLTQIERLIQKRIPVVGRNGVVIATGSEPAGREYQHRAPGPRQADEQRPAVSRFNDVHPGTHPATIREPAPMPTDRRPGATGQRQGFGGQRSGQTAQPVPQRYQPRRRSYHP